MSVETPAPAVQPENPPENSTIRQMREQIASLNSAKAEADAKLQEAQSQLQEIERAKLEENERLKLEKADLEKKIADADQIRDELGRYKSTFETLYNEKLATVPEEQRANVEVLTSKGTWAERYEALQAATKLIPAAPTAAGTVTQPTSVTPTTPAPSTWDPTKGPPPVEECFKPRS